MNSPMDNWFQANDHQLSLRIPKFKKVGYRRCDGCLQENLGCSLTSVVVSLEFIMVQMHINVSDYSLKFHVSNCQNCPILLQAN